MPGEDPNAHSSCLTDRPAGRGGLVETPHGRGVRSFERHLGILGGLPQDLGDRFGEAVERLARLRLGGLDHQRLLDQQREVDRRRVIAEVQETLGQVQGADLKLPLHRPAREHELVHAELAVGERQETPDVALAQPGQQVVGIQDGRLRGLPQTLSAERADVGVGAHEAAVVPLEAAQPPDRERPVVVELEALLAPHEHRPRQERLDPLGYGDRARAGPAAAVGLREGLVQVEVDDVEAHVARPREAHDGVQVGAVVVERGPDAVHDPGDLLDVLVEQAERVRVRQHQAGHLVVGLRAAGRRGRCRRSRWWPA